MDPVLTLIVAALALNGAGLGLGEGDGVGDGGLGRITVGWLTGGGHTAQLHTLQVSSW